MTRVRALCLASIALALAPLPAGATVGPPAPIAAKATPAQQAMADYKSKFGPVSPAAPCQRHPGDEITVCGSGGRGGSPDRLPLPDERGPPDHARLAVGEVRPDMSAPPGMSSCASQDPGTRCGGGVSFIAAALFGVKLARALIDPEGASDEADARAAARR